MNLIFSILKKLKKYGFNFLQTQKTWIYFIIYMKKLEEYLINFFKFKKAQKRSI